MNCRIGLKRLTATTLLLMGLHLTATANETELEPAHSLAIRDGLPNVAQKLQSGEDVSVVFIGGSITVGGGRSFGYVTKVEEWLKTHYPQSAITVHNAGISGTDSNFGAKRYDRDVLKFKPDLVLIEFCVNDGDRDHTMHMERIVHKTWLQNPKTDIAIFYTLAESHLPAYAKGMLPPSASAHERVAAFYGIPSIGPAHDVAQKVNSGEMEWKDFSNDGCHPHQAGYGFFERSFHKALPVLLEAGEPGAHWLNRSITPDLVVYPPKIQTVPQEIPALVRSDGAKAKRSFALPRPGIHWKEEPSFQDENGQTIWRLHYLTRVRDTSEQVGLDKADWAGNSPVWFEEAKAFSIPNGGILFRSSGKPNSSAIGFSDRQLSLISFIAPETGRYVFQVEASGISAHRSEDKTFGLNMAVFRWGKDRGTPLKSVAALKEALPDLDWEVEVELTAGEEVTFTPVTDAPGHIRGSINNLIVQVGLM